MDGAFETKGMIIYYVIKLHDQILWQFPDEINSDNQFFEGARDALELFHKQRPEISLLEPGLRLEFYRSQNDGGGS